MPMTVKGMRCLLLSRSSKDRTRSTCGIGWIDFCVSIFSIDLFNGVISSKDYIVEDIVKSSIQDSKSVGSRSLELRYCIISSMCIR